MADLEGAWKTVNERIINVEQVSDCPYHEPDAERKNSMGEQELYCACNYYSPEQECNCCCQSPPDTCPLDKLEEGEIVSKELEERILSTMTEDTEMIKFAAGEECVELAQTILKSGRLGEDYRDRKTNQTFVEKAVEETA